MVEDRSSGGLPLILKGEGRLFCEALLSGLNENTEGTLTFIQGAWGRQSNVGNVEDVWVELIEAEQGVGRGVERCFVWC